MLAEIGKGAAAVVERSRKGMGWRQTVIEGSHAAVGLQRQSGTEARTTVDAAEAPAASVEIEQQRTLAEGWSGGREEADVGGGISGGDAVGQLGRLVAALPDLLQGCTVAGDSRAHRQHLSVLQVGRHTAEEVALVVEHTPLERVGGIGLPIQTYHGKQQE